MAHWLLRERMAEHTEDGRERQERVGKEQHRPEQIKGHGEAALEEAGKRKDKTEEQRPFND